MSLKDCSVSHSLLICPKILHTQICNATSCWTDFFYLACSVSVLFSFLLSFLPPFLPSFLPLFLSSFLHFFFVFDFFKTVFLSIVLDPVLEQAVKSTPTWNSHKYSCLYLWLSGNKGEATDNWLKLCFCHGLFVCFVLFTFSFRNMVLCVSALVFMEFHLKINLSLSFCDLGASSSKILGKRC